MCEALVLMPPIINSIFLYVLRYHSIFINPKRGLLRQVIHEKTKSDIPVALGSRGKIRAPPG